MKKIIKIIFILVIIFYISGSFYEKLKQKEVCKLRFCKSGVDCWTISEYKECLKWKFYD